jgi:Fe-S cluster assembly protein SufD
MNAAATTDGHPDVLDGIGLPTKRDEAWRYAPHRQLAELTFGPTVNASSVSPLELDGKVPELDGPRIVVVNGVVDRELSRFDAVAGAHLTSLADATGVDADVVRRHRSDVRIVDAYSALNAEYATDGVVLLVDAGVQLDMPIHVVDVTTPDSSANSVNTSNTRVVIELAVGSAATVVETRVGAGAGFGGSSVHTSVVLAEDARLEHVLVQDLPAGQIHLARVTVRQGANSTLHTRSFNLGSSYGRLAYDVDLLGAGASADLSGLFFGVGEQILDQQITVVHDAPDCTSRQTFRGVLDDASTGVFNGGIDVCPGADGTDAEQSNDNLLLSNRAEVNTQPRLEILADEVACKHGATVGQLDDTALYYLRSRGLDADDARRLLINGFADQIVDDVSVEAVRNWITHRLGHDHD